MPLPPLIIDAPPLGRTRRPGLLLAATGPVPIEQHAETVGTRWWSNACGGAHLYPAACSDVAYPQMVKDAASGLQDAVPFVVYASIECPPVGSSAAAAREKVAERLEASEGRAVELAFWGGEGTVPGLVQQLNTAGKVSLLNGGTAVGSVKEGMSLLEQQAASASYDGPVILHARPRIAAYAGGAGLLRTRVSSDGEHIFTWDGTEVSFGAGYAGSSPDNATAPDATTEYMAITGRVLLGRSEIFYQDPPEELLDRVKNQRAIVAWRVYTMAVECLTAVVKVTRA